MLRGVDISAYQDHVPSGQDFVIVKATDGTSYFNHYFPAWYSQLNKAGKLKGVYHFARPNNDPIREANYFLGAIHGRWEPGDLLVLDLEVASGQHPDHVARWAQSWMKTVANATDVDPILYTYISFIEDGYCDGLSGYPLWIADPSSPAGKPRVPAPFKDWVLHQYGEQSLGDLDVFNGGANDWRKLGGIVSIDPPSPPKVPTQVLKLGSKAKLVTTLQKKLNEYGAKLSVDGVFGPKTETAVKSFQKSKNLTVDGIVGPKTWAALYK